MSVSTNSNQFFQISQLKTLADLKALNDDNQARINAFEILIVDSQDNIQEFILPALIAYTLEDLFPLSENSPMIKDLCQKPEAEIEWRKRLQRLNINLPNVSTNAFDTLMGFYLSHHYRAYQTLGQEQNLQAITLLAEIRARGIDQDREVSPIHAYNGAPAA